MPYTSEVFNRYKPMVDHSGSQVIRAIMYLLRPDDGYTKVHDDILKERYVLWQTDSRAMDAACGESWAIASQAPLVMPPDDEAHKPCRMMAASLIERAIYGEGTACYNLANAVEKVRANLEECAKHPPSCACRQASNRWTYENKKLVDELRYEIDAKERSMVEQPYTHDATICACRACYDVRVKNGSSVAYTARWRSRADLDATVENRGPIANLLEAATQADNAISDARNMPGGSTDEGFVKNLFKTVQGVNYDDKCPHGLPFYACMSCSH